MTPDFLTEKEAAEYIKMSRSFLSHRRIEGNLKEKIPGPVFFTVGRNIRYSIKDLDEWKSVYFIRHSSLRNR